MVQCSALVVFVMTEGAAAVCKFFRFSHTARSLSCQENGGLRDFKQFQCGVFFAKNAFAVHDRCLTFTCNFNVV